MLKIVNIFSGAVVAAYAFDFVPQDPSTTGYWQNMSEGSKQNHMQQYESRRKDAEKRNAERRAMAQTALKALNQSQGLGPVYDTYVLLDTGDFDIYGDMQVECNHG